MTRINKKLSAVVTSCLCVASAFAGCSSGNEKSAAASATANAEKNTADSVQNSEEKSAAGASATASDNSFSLNPEKGWQKCSVDESSPEADGLKNAEVTLYLKLASEDNSCRGNGYGVVFNANSLNNIDADFGAGSNVISNASSSVKVNDYECKVLTKLYMTDDNKKVLMKLKAIKTNDKIVGTVFYVYGDNCENYQQEIDRMNDSISFPEK